MNHSDLPRGLKVVSFLIMENAMKQFHFKTYTVLTDNEIVVRINKTLEPSTETGWLPSSEFDIYQHNTGERGGGNFCSHDRKGT